MHHDLPTDQVSMHPIKSPSNSLDECKNVSSSTLVVNLFGSKKALVVLVDSCHIVM